MSEPNKTVKELVKKYEGDVISEFTDAEEDIKPKDRKKYMKEYYNLNKKAVINKMLTKEKCKYCDRNVAHQQMHKHQLTGYCKKRRLQNMAILKEMKEHYKSIGMPPIIEGAIDNGE